MSVPTSILVLENAGFQAWMCVDGMSTVLYSPETRMNTVTAWIASEADKTFSIHWRDTKRTINSSGYVYVDGESCGGKGLYSSRTPGNRGRTDTAYRSSVSTSPTTRRPLMFSKLETTDDDNFLLNSASLEFGQIRLTIKEVRIMPTYRPPSHSHGTTAQIPKSSVTFHERSKKAAANHHIKLGNEYRSHKDHRNATHNKPIREITTFIFKYRPLSTLMATGIATNMNQAAAPMAFGSSSAPPTGEVIDLTEDLSAEIEDSKPKSSYLDKREERRLGAKVKTKTEPDIVKQETGLKVSAVIDLTEDD